MIILNEFTIGKPSDPIYNRELNKLKLEKKKRKALYSHRGRMIGAGLSLANDIHNYCLGKSPSVVKSAIKTSAAASLGGFIGRRMA